jgi:hypothetical protein
MLFSEAHEPGHEPQRGEGHRGRHGEHVAGADFPQPACRVPQEVEGLGDGAVIGFARGRECQRLVAPFEERHAHEGLQRLDLAADGRLGKEELRRGARERQVPGGRLEAAQELQGRQAALRTSHASGSW